MVWGVFFVWSVFGIEWCVSCCFVFWFVVLLRVFFSWFFEWFFFFIIICDLYVGGRIGEVDCFGLFCWCCGSSLVFCCCYVVFFVVGFWGCWRLGVFVDSLFVCFFVNVWFLGFCWVVCVFCFDCVGEISYLSFFCSFF